MNSTLASLIEANCITDDNHIVESLCAEAASATVVLLGEATHGTQEFYDMRSEITKMLITKHGFTGVVLEADLIDTITANDKSKSMDEVMTQFKRRFPKWMWSNQPIRSFVKFLRDSNVPLYGFDCYAVKESIDYVLKYLSGIDPNLYNQAMGAYASLIQYETMETYRSSVSTGAVKSCCAEVTDILFKIKELALYSNEWFLAVQCARTIKTGERYYRGRIPGQKVSVDTWNIRDQHMSDTVQEVLMQQSITGVERPKVVIWAHNSHLGDARGTSYTERGEWNVGQLLRESFGLENVYNLGFLTYNGSVRAAHSWGEDSTVMQIKDATKESWSGMFKEVGIPKFLLKMRSSSSEGVDEDLVRQLSSARPERAIGVLYKRETEATSHMFMAALPWQFDSVIYIEKTSALLVD